MTDVPYEQHRPFGINWVCLQKSVRTIAMCGFFFAAGGWLASIRDEAARLPYLQRSTKTNEKVTAVAGPNPVATINCLKRKSAVATSVAGQAVLAANSDDAAVPSLSQIPRCPQPPKAPPPNVTARK